MGASASHDPGTQPTDGRFGPVLTLADLRAGLEVLLSEIERRYGPKVDLCGGFYWDLPMETIYDSLQDPAPPTLGDLVDDVESLGELLGREPGEVYVWHDLSHVVGVLRRLAALDLPPGMSDVVET